MIARALVAATLLAFSPSTRASDNLPLPIRSSESLFHKTRNWMVAVYGEPRKDLHDGASTPGAVDIERFEKGGWVIKATFKDGLPQRFTISKTPISPLSDREISAFLAPVHPYAKWKLWSNPSHRA